MIDRKGSLLCILALPEIFRDPSKISLKVNFPPPMLVFVIVSGFWSQCDGAGVGLGVDVLYFIESLIKSVVVGSFMIFFLTLVVPQFRFFFFLKHHIYKACYSHGMRFTMKFYMLYIQSASSAFFQFDLHWHFMLSGNPRCILLSLPISRGFLLKKCFVSLYTLGLMYYRM